MIHSYIVNCPVYNNVKDPDSTRKEVEKILKACRGIAVGNRKISLVIGLNSPEGKGDPNKLEEIARMVKEICEKSKNSSLNIDVCQYKWAGFESRMVRKPIANEGINYVDIRNKLFYSDANKSAISKSIDELKRSGANGTVKLIALDGDTEINSEMIDKLESNVEGSYKNYSNRNNAKELPAIINSGLYTFKFDNGAGLVQKDNTLSWGVFLASIENKLDHDFKEKIKDSRVTADVCYRTLHLSPEEKKTGEISNVKLESIFVKAAKNMHIFSKIDSSKFEFKNKEKYELLKQAYECLTSLKSPYKQIIKDKDPNPVCKAAINQEIKNLVLKIDALESEFSDDGVELEEISYKFQFPGADVLYPSENIMFVSMYEKMGNYSFDFFKEIDKRAKAKEIEEGKSTSYEPRITFHHLWGDDVGREEGENIAAQMRKIWKGSGHTDYLKRKIVDYPHTFQTALPPRAHEFVTKEQEAIAKRLPKNIDELEEIINDDVKLNLLVENVLTLFSLRSQTSLGTKFLSQRLRNIKGEQKKEGHVLQDPPKKLSPFEKSFRPAIAKGFTSFYESENKKEMEVRKKFIVETIKAAYNKARAEEA